MTIYGKESTRIELRRKNLRAVSGTTDRDVYSLSKPNVV